MRKSIPAEYILAAAVLAAIVNATVVLLDTTVARIVGLILGLLQISIIDTLRPKWGRYLIAATIINVVLSALLLVGYCSIRSSPACEANPLSLSIIPASILALFWIAYAGRYVLETLRRRHG